MGHPARVDARRRQDLKRAKLNDDATCANHMVPNLALDPTDGTLHATFFENRGGAGHLLRDVQAERRRATRRCACRAT
jgi:hypothetical protein